MTWNDVAVVVAAAVPPTCLFAAAVWRFARLESVVGHQARCSRMVVKAVVRLRRDLNRHIRDNSKEGTS